MDDILVTSSLEEVEQHLAAGEARCVIVDSCEKRAEIYLRSDEWRKKEITKELVSFSSLSTVVSQVFFLAVDQAQLLGSIREQQRLKSLTVLAKKHDAPVIYADLAIDDILRYAWHNLKGRQKLKLVQKIRRYVFTRSPPKNFGTDSSAIEKIIDDIRSINEACAAEIENIRACRILVAAKTHNRCVIFVNKRLRERLLAMRGEEASMSGSSLQPRQQKIKVGTVLKYLVLPVFALYVVSRIIARPLPEIYSILLLWALLTASFSAAGALAARAHPISVLVALGLAPLMSMALIGSGWVAGIVELRLRKPRIEDVVRLGKAEKISYMMFNRAMRPLFVGLFTNIGNICAVVLLLWYISLI